MTSVEIDLNLAPVTTVIRAELDMIILLCQAEEGARPATTITWYNLTKERSKENLTDHSQDHIASLQSDGTYVMLSRLIVDTRPWHHGNTLTYVPSQTSNHVITVGKKQNTKFKIKTTSQILNK